MPTMRTNVFDDLFNTPFFTKSESSMMKTTAKTITPFFNVYICNLLLSCFVGIVFLYSNLFLKNEKRFEYYKNVRNLNFEEFIRYFPDSGQATEAEFEALKKLDDWPFKHSSMAFSSSARTSGL